MLEALSFLSGKFEPIWIPDTELRIVQCRTKIGGTPTGTVIPKVCGDGAKREYVALDNL